MRHHLIWGFTYWFPNSVMACKTVIFFQMGQPSPIAVPQPDLTVPPPQVFYTAPPPQMSPIDDLTTAISTMEFRRGGSGPMYTRKHDNRAPQQLYQPPVQRR